MIITEQTEEKPVPHLHELATAASVLRTHSGHRITLVIAGQASEEAARTLSGQYNFNTILIRQDMTHQDTALPFEILLRTLPAALLQHLDPAYILLPHNTQTLDAAPALAVKCRGACVTGVEKIFYQNNTICFHRSLFSDRITATIRPSADTTVLTIAAGAFKPEPESAGAPENPAFGKISVIEPEPYNPFYHQISLTDQADDTAALDQADVIVSAGNGIREQENLDLIFDLAKLFPKSAVAGSRPVCDRKWLQYARQVGVTGATVRPKLYIACGISGASQHITGMQDARFIVSINTDPHAAIFNVSDVCIVEDLTTFIPRFITTWHEKISDIPRHNKSS